ncbi:hypothetical protein ABMA27_010697 [Loxostege sticticalis]|uniref:THAP-type domain-containing protein n=1 Tax=Loxostege sticticalis TaxID=481309 RepID=A0ABR3H415_LOXSC
MKKKKSCIVDGCLNNNTCLNLTFFTLPKDIERRREWLTLINRQDLLQKENLNHISYVLCSAHFEDSSIIIVKRLNENAVPTLLLPKKFEEKVPIVAEEIIKEGKVYEEVTPRFF